MEDINPQQFLNYYEINELDKLNELDELVKNSNITLGQNLQSLQSYIVKCSGLVNNNEILHGGVITANNPRDVFFEYLNKGQLNIANVSEVLSTTRNYADNTVNVFDLSVNKDDINPDLAFHTLDTCKLIHKNLIVENLCVKIIFTTNSNNSEPPAPVSYRTKTYDYIHPKLSAITSHSEIRRYLDDQSFSTFKTANVADIISEIVHQNIAVQCTNKYFEPVSPYIVYADILSNLESIDYLNLFKEKAINGNLQNMFDNFIDFLNKNKQVNMSLIVTDLQKSVNKLSDFDHHKIICNNIPMYITCLRYYEIIRLIISSKIVPLNINPSDFMFTNSCNYIGNSSERIKLINYKNVYVLSEEKYVSFIANLKKHGYFDSLLMLYHSITRSSEFSELISNDIKVKMINEDIMSYEFYEIFNKIIQKIFRNRKTNISKLFYKYPQMKQLSDNIEIINKKWMFGMLNVIVKEKENFKVLYKDIAYDITPINGSIVKKMFKTVISSFDFEKNDSLELIQSSQSILREDLVNILSEVKRIFNNKNKNINRITTTGRRASAKYFFIYLATITVLLGLFLRI